MQKDRGFRILAIVAICIAVVSLSIGYAALRQELTINSTATLKQGTWKVEFVNLAAAVLTGTATEEVPATSTATNVTVNVNLVKPGDKAVYEFDVTNTGSIAAKLNALPTFSDNLAAAQAKKINYSLTYADGTALNANDPLAANGGTKRLKLTIEYDPTATEADLVETDTSFAITATLLYVQE